jgi:hypothetical protein
MPQPQSWVDAAKRDEESKHIVSSQNQKPSFIPHTKPVTPTPPTPLKIQKLTREEMAKHQLKGLCYKCDDKYFLGHKCNEKNIFMSISKDVLEDDVEAPLVATSLVPIDLTAPSDPLEVKLVISMNSLTGFSAPQTFKFIGYIKHRKVIILFDSGRTHNFIHRHISQETNCYTCTINNFQITIANGRSMKCEGHCENVCLQIG